MAVEPAVAAATFRARQAAADAVARGRAKRILGSLPACVALLRAEFGASRIWLFGSLARGEPHAESDLDLAVLGLDPALVDRASAALERIAACPVDIVPMESAVASFWATLAAEGREF
jgi:predicted nucleotidyltransferase